MAAMTDRAERASTSELPHSTLTVQPNWSKDTTWRARLELIRSALQKAIRRGDDKLLTQVVVLYIHERKGLSALRNLVLFMVEDLAASPHLFLYVVPHIHALLKRAPKSSELLQHPDFCQEMMALIRLVGDPRWPRQRFTALLANRSLVAIERQEQIKPATAASALLLQLMEMDRLWITDEKAWKKQCLQRLFADKQDPVSQTFHQAFRILPNRLVWVLYLCLKHNMLEIPNVGPTEPSIDRLHGEFKTWSITEALANPIVPEWPDYVLDKHTRQGREKGKDLTHFFTQAAWVVNEGPVPYLLRSLVQEGRQAYDEMEGKYGTPGAKSSAIRDRVRRIIGVEDSTPTQVEASQEEAKRKSVVAKSGHKRKTTSEHPEEKHSNLQLNTPVAGPVTKVKRIKKDPRIFQEAMRQRLEPLMPEELRGLPWLQPMTSEAKRPVMLHGDKVWKGPCPMNYPYRERVQMRYETIRHSGVFTPPASWVIKTVGETSYLWWVSDYVPGLQNPFEAEQPLTDIPDSAHFIQQLVKSGVVKLALGMGDLCTRNMPWSSSLQQFVLLDLEDANPHLPDVRTCSLFEWCFSPATRARKEKRDRVETLIRKHKDAILQGLEEIRPHLALSMERIEQVKTRLRSDTPDMV